MCRAQDARTALFPHSLNAAESGNLGVSPASFRRRLAMSIRIDRAPLMGTSTKAKHGAQDWFQRNILKHRDVLKRYLLGFTKSPEDAEDLEQEAYLRVISSRDRQEIGNPRGFLFVTARNLAIEAWRRKTNSPVHSVEDFDALNVRDICASVDSEVLTDELLAAFGEAIDALPPQARRVFIMRKVFGLSHKEIAAELGLSCKTIEKHVGKGISRCGDFLRERDLQFGESGQTPVAERSRKRSGDDP